MIASIDEEPPSSVGALEHEPATSEPAGPSPSRTLRRNLASSYSDGAAWSVMVGCGETFLPAFALAAGIGEVSAGLVATVPLLLGATLQMLAPVGLRKLGSHRRWVVLCAFLQGVSFLPLMIAAALNRVPAALVFLAAGMYWGCGLATGPAWNTWIGTLIPRRILPTFFARRTRFSQAGLLVGFVAGGLALQLGTSLGHTLETFALLFLVAAVSRFISSGFLARQSEPTPINDNHRDVPLGEIMNRLRGSTDGSLLLYFLAVQCAVQISGPYFNPYMLGHLKLSYVQYVMLVGAALIARVMAMPVLGRVAAQYGARRLLWLGGVGIVPLSGAWLFSNSFGYLVLLQAIVGVAWGAYELGMFLSFFEHIKVEERTSMLTKFNFAHAVATAAGSFLGAAVLAAGDKATAMYLTLFVCSSAARLASLGLLWRVPSKQPARRVAPAHKRQFATAR